MSPSYPETLRTFLRIGLLSFGGPAGQIATMHRILVEEKRWLDEPRFLHALNFCMLLPGPEAQQLATYSGWLLHGTRGGLAAGILFVLPGFLVMLGLAALYAGLTHVPVVQGLFLGLKPAVLAVVVQAGLRIGTRALSDNWARGLALASFLAIFVLAVPFPLIVLAAGLAGWLRGRGGAVPPPAPKAGNTLGTALLWLLLWLAPVGLAWAYGQGAFATIGMFFAKLAVVTFGGAYAALSYVAQQAVENHGWISAGEMLDGLGLAETTPGPLVLVNQFVGFLAGYRQPGGLNPWLGGVLAASLTVWVTFVPSFLWIFAGAPHVERLRGHAALSAALSAITAAVVGVIFNLALWFALHVAFARFDGNWPQWDSAQPLQLVLAAGAMVAMLRFKLGMLPVLGVCAAIGAVASLV
ncbi:MAG: chromate [Rhodospirillaceae bacterium]|nr:MAG: chromate [Rhodospirillaceae bacterium]TNC96710.1 MAG: chromate transporter [Stygiobacter sp.]